MKKGTLGVMIKEKRNALGMTAEKLANKVGIDRTYLSKIETQGFLPSPMILKKIIEHLGEIKNNRYVSYFRIYEKLKYPSFSNIRHELFDVSRQYEISEERYLFLARRLFEDWKKSAETSNSQEERVNYRKGFEKFQKLIKKFTAEYIKIVKETEPVRFEHIVSSKNYPQIKTLLK